jgi:hypothetical protein
MKVFFILISLFFSFGIIAQADYEKLPNSKELKILKLSKDKFRWLTHGKLDSLLPILDPRIIYSHSNGWQQTKDDIIQDTKSKKLIYKNISVSKSRAEIFPKMAIVFGEGIFSGEVESTPFELKLRYTEVYRKHKNSWLLVSRNANKF